MSLSLLTLVLLCGSVQAEEPDDWELAWDEVRNVMPDLADASLILRRTGQSWTAFVQDGNRTAQVPQPAAASHDARVEQIYNAIAQLEVPSGSWTIVIVPPRLPPAPSPPPVPRADPFDIPLVEPPVLATIEPSPVPVLPAPQPSPPTFVETPPPVVQAPPPPVRVVAKTAQPDRSRARGWSPSWAAGLGADAAGAASIHGDLRLNQGHLWLGLRAVVGRGLSQPLSSGGERLPDALVVTRFDGLPTVEAGGPEFRVGAVGGFSSRHHTFAKQALGWATVPAVGGLVAGYVAEHRVRGELYATRDLRTTQYTNQGRTWTTAPLRVGVSVALGGGT